MGSDSEGNGQEIHLDGPIVGLYGSYSLELDGLNFYVDKTYCSRSQINAMNLPDESTPLGTKKTISLIPLSGVMHQLGGDIYA